MKTMNNVILSISFLIILLIYGEIIAFIFGDVVKLPLAITFVFTGVWLWTYLFVSDLIEKKERRRKR